MMNTKTLTLTLQILNQEYLASGKQANILICSEGATIGSALNNIWSIQNQKGQIKKLHARVAVSDHHFYIVAHESEIYLNDIDLFAKAQSVGLRNGDFIKLCGLNIRVQVNQKDQFLQKQLSILPENIISNYSDPINEILTKKINTPYIHETSLYKKVTVMSSLPLDPLKVLDDESIKPNK